MKHRPYPKYKPSGVEWLGEIPAEWDLRPLFSVLTESQVKNVGNQVQNVLSLSYGRIIDRDVESNHGLLPESFETYQIVQDNDIILRLTDLQNDQRSLRVGQVNKKGIITSAYVCLTPSKNMLPKYAYLLLHAYDKLKIFYGLGGGVRQSMKFVDLKRLSLVIPPIEQQSIIATFLDRETDKIDTLIAKQEKLIDLLKEKRQAVISHAVTKGLDPTVPMKSSGVEWLGDVPEHWKLTRLGWITTEINDINHDMPAAVDSGVLFLSAKDLLDDGTLNFTEDVKQISEEDFQKLSKKILPQKNDIIYSRIGARLGKARLVETNLKFLVSYSCCIIRVTSDLGLSAYICKLLDTDLVLTEAKARTNGIGVPDLGLDEIARFPIPLPPIDEQDAINAFLEQQTAKFSLLIAKAQQAIALQKEHRTALIFAAVTGKIDVRSEVRIEEKRAA